MLDALKDGERASGDLVMGAGCPAGWHARGEAGERAVRLGAEGVRQAATGVARPLLRATQRLLAGTTALRRTKGWDAVLAALASGLVLRSLRYTLTGSRSAVTAATWWSGRVGHQTRSPMVSRAAGTSTVRTSRVSSRTPMATAVPTSVR